MRSSVLMMALMTPPACEAMSVVDSPVSTQATLEAELFDPQLLGYEAGAQTETDPKRREYEAYIERTEARIEALDDWLDRIEVLHDDLGNTLRPRDKQTLDEIEGLRSRVLDGVTDLGQELDRLESRDPTISAVTVEQTRKRIEQDLRSAEQRSAASWKRLQSKAKEFEQ